jgi:hypothetical protein
MKFKILQIKERIQMKNNDFLLTLILIVLLGFATKFFIVLHEVTSKQEKAFKIVRGLD